MNENEDLGPLSVLHQKCSLPLFYFPYHIIVSKDPTLAKEYIQEEWAGIEVGLTNKSLSLTCTIKHDIAGDAVVCYICTESLDPNQPLECVIAHEATNLSWILAENLNVNIDADNYAVQAYMISEILGEIFNVIKTYEEKNTDIDDL